MTGKRPKLSFGPWPVFLAANVVTIAIVAISSYSDQELVSWPLSAYLLCVNLILAAFRHRIDPHPYLFGLTMSSAFSFMAAIWEACTPRPVMQLELGFVALLHCLFTVAVGCLALVFVGTYSIVTWHDWSTHRKETLAS